MSSIDLLTDAQALIASPLVLSAIGATLTVMIASRLFQMFLLAGSDNAYSWEDDHFEYWEHGFASREDWEAEVNASGGRRAWLGDD